MTQQISIHHISLIISDTKKSLAFYNEVLGLICADRPDLGFPGAWLQVNETQQIHLLELPNPDPVTGRPDHGGRDRHLALQVDELDCIRERLQRHGVHFSVSQSGRSALFCRDPDGNAIELLTIQ